VEIIDASTIQKMLMKGILSVWSIENFMPQERVVEKHGATLHVGIFEFVFYH